MISYTIVPDEREQIQATLLDLADRQHVDLILTTGGTGPTSRDVPPSTAPREDKEGRCP